MRTRLILRPGQPGTKGLVKKYGDALLCIRFTYEATLRQRLKTVELIGERTEWTPPPPRYASGTPVPLRIEAVDMQMRAQAKTAGGVLSGIPACRDHHQCDIPQQQGNNNTGCRYARPQSLGGLLRPRDGRWDPEKRSWFVKHGKIAGTPLKNYIQVDGADRTRRTEIHLPVDE